MDALKKTHLDPGERRLIERCQKGDREAFDRLFGLYQDRIYNSVRHFLGNDEESSDVCQEVFVHVFRSIKSFRGESGFFTWLYRIVMNITRNRYKQKYRRRRLIAEPLDHEGAQDPLEKAVSHDPGPEAQAQSLEMTGIIRRELNRLSPDQREALVLREIEGFSYEEISSILQEREGTIKSRIARGRTILQQKLKPYL